MRMFLIGFTVSSKETFNLQGVYPEFFIKAESEDDVLETLDSLFPTQTVYVENIAELVFK